MSLSGGAKTISNHAAHLNGLDAWRRAVRQIDSGMGVRLGEPRREMRAIHLKRIRDLDAAHVGVAAFDEKVREFRGAGGEGFSGASSLKSVLLAILPSELRKGLRVVWLATERAADFGAFRGFVLTLTARMLSEQRRGKGIHAVEQPEYNGGDSPPRRSTSNATIATATSSVPLNASSRKATRHRNAPRGMTLLASVGRLSAKEEHSPGSARRADVLIAASGTTARAPSHARSWLPGFAGRAGLRATCPRIVPRKGSRLPRRSKAGLSPLSSAPMWLGLYHRVPRGKLRLASAPCLEVLCSGASSQFQRQCIRRVGLRLWRPSYLRRCNQEGGPVAERPFYFGGSDRETTKCFDRMRCET